jgi:hypothetical protein
MYFLYSISLLMQSVCNINFNTSSSNTSTFYHSKYTHCYSYTRDSHALCSMTYRPIQVMQSACHARPTYIHTELTFSMTEDPLMLYASTSVTNYSLIINEIEKQLNSIIIYTAYRCFIILRLH